MKLYQQLFQEMLSIHKDLFAKFKDIHDKYAIDPKKYQAQFNEIGDEVMTIIRKYENRLCSKTERSSYSKFSMQLSDKFWSGVRAIYPKIDFVGAERL